MTVIKTAGVIFAIFLLLSYSGMVWMFSTSSIASDFASKKKDAERTWAV